MIPWPNLPYEIIGQTVVAIFALALGILLTGAVVLGVLFTWVRVWRWISNKMWDGYEPNGERPPVWKMRISGISLALSQFKFRKIPAAYHEADKLTDDDTTAKQAMNTYLSQTFLDE